MFGKIIVLSTQLHCYYESRKNKLKERYEQFWGKNMKSDKKKKAKLRTYKLIEEKFGLEKYLELNERKYRKALSTFRISAHRLNIERGRYMKLKVRIDYVLLAM